MLTHFNLTLPEHSYFIGFAQADGSLSQETRNRGKFKIELQKTDEYILHKFKSLFNVYSSITYRTRDTNFCKDYSCVTWSVSNKDFRDQLESSGIPVGKKSNIVNIPTVNFSEIDYFRGIIDGDGSLGFTKLGFPFISLVTSSDQLTQSYNDFIFRMTGSIKKLSRNKRDNVYNIMIVKEDAQKIINLLYYDNCLCLPRKYLASMEVRSWIRPSTMKKRDVLYRSWLPEEEAYVLKHSIKDSVAYLGRSTDAVKIRRGRLRRALKSPKNTV